MGDVGLTELQLEIMQVLWDRNGGTVADVHEAVGVPRKLAQATVATLLRRLEKKGAVTHEKDGRQFVYRAKLSSESVRRSMVAEVAERLFPGQVPALINYLMSERKIGANELAEVKALIEAKEREAREG